MTDYEQWKTTQKISKPAWYRQAVKIIFQAAIGLWLIIYHPLIALALAGVGASVIVIVVIVETIENEGKKTRELILQSLQKPN